MIEQSWILRFIQSSQDVCHQSRTDTLAYHFDVKDYIDSDSFTSIKVTISNEVVMRKCIPIGYHTDSNMWSYYEGVRQILKDSVTNSEHTDLIPPYIVEKLLGHDEVPISEEHHDIIPHLISCCINNETMRLVSFRAGSQRMYLLVELPEIAPVDRELIWFAMINTKWITDLCEMNSWDESVVDVSEIIRYQTSLAKQVFTSSIDSIGSSAA